MAIPAKQQGWGPVERLLHNISKQLDRLTNVTGKSAEYVSSALFDGATDLLKLTRKGGTVISVDMDRKDTKDPYLLQLGLLQYLILVNQVNCLLLQEQEQLEQGHFNYHQQLEQRTGNIEK